MHTFSNIYILLKGVSVLQYQASMSYFAKWGADSPLNCATVRQYLIT